MRRLSTLGRCFFWTAIFAFAVEHLAAAISPAVPPPGPPWPPDGRLQMWLTGLALLTIVVFVAAKKTSRTNALGLVFLLSIVASEGVGKLLSNPRDYHAWTSTFQLLAMAGVGLILAGLEPAEDLRTPETLLLMGRGLFASSLFVFGAQHFLYADFLSTLIPSWIAAPQVWAYAVGVVFFAAAVAIFAKRERSVGKLLAAMFSSWILILHLPRVVAAPASATERTSLFMALAMAGGSLILAEARTFAR